MFSGFGVSLLIAGLVCIVLVWVVLRIFLRPQVNTRADLKSCSPPESTQSNQAVIILQSGGRVEYVSVTDAEALEAFRLCCVTEGIIPALEPAHALAHVTRIAPDLPSGHLLVMNLCGRGDKDIFTVADALGVAI